MWSEARHSYRLEWLRSLLQLDTDSVDGTALAVAVSADLGSVVHDKVYSLWSK